MLNWNVTLLFKKGYVLFSSIKRDIKQRDAKSSLLLCRNFNYEAYFVTAVKKHTESAVRCAV